ncbi:MAG TPA: tetratricopeptide repeat protein, partial [Deltaproteobacteria bacterium]|nr:tetratricopeptide repeat protein [Deltaproteobacteria bacterium]
KTNDLHEPIDTSQIRRQLIDAGIRSIPIEIFYIEHTIAKVPLEIDLDKQDFMERIREAKDIDGKIALLKSAHTSFPKDRQIVGMLDQLLSQKGDYETLAGIYKGLLASDPEDVSSYAQLSRCYTKLGMLKEAIDMESKIVEKGRASAATYRRMAFLAGESGDLGGRIGYLEMARNLAPGDESIIIDLAKTYEQAGKSAKALEIYRSSSGRAKDRAILIPVIEDSLKKKKYDEAASLLKRYIVYYPQDKNAYAQLAMVMGKLGQTDSQTAYYSKAVELNSSDPVLLFNLAASYEKSGKDKSALDTYKRVLAVKPGDRDSLVRAAALSEKAGDYRSSYEYYQALVKIDDSAVFKKGLVSAAVGLKDSDKIISASKEYLKESKNYDVAITLAYAYESRAASRQGRQRLEDLSAALDAYQLALKINPRSKKAQEKIPELKIETIKLKRGA